MEEQTPPTPTISFGDIIMNVFASPSEAFEGIRTSPTRASVWVVPLIVVMLFSSCLIWMIFSDETMKNQVIEMQRDRMQEQVAAGKITQDRADQTMEQMEKAGGMMIAIGIVSVIFMLTITFFLAGLIFWLIGKFGLKAVGGYGKYLELWGATQWIGALAVIVTMLLAMAFSSMHASPSAALAVLGSFNPKDTTHRILSSINFFLIWQMVVAGIGMAKYSGKSVGTGVGVGLGLMLVWVLFFVFAMPALGLSVGTFSKVDCQLGLHKALAPELAFAIANDERLVTPTQGCTPGILNEN